jgi:hypothetical protein
MLPLSLEPDAENETARGILPDPVDATDAAIGSVFVDGATCTVLLRTVFVRPPRYTNGLMSVAWYAVRGDPDREVDQDVWLLA